MALPIGFPRARPIKMIKVVSAIGQELILEAGKSNDDKINWTWRIADSVPIVDASIFLLVCFVWGPEIIRRYIARFSLFNNLLFHEYNIWYSLVAKHRTAIRIENHNGFRNVMRSAHVRKSSRLFHIQVRSNAQYQWSTPLRYDSTSTVGHSIKFHFSLHFHM